MLWCVIWDPKILGLLLLRLILVNLGIDELNLFCSSQNFGIPARDRICRPHLEHSCLLESQVLEEKNWLPTIIFKLQSTSITSLVKAVTKTQKGFRNISYRGLNAAHPHTPDSPLTDRYQTNPLQIRLSSWDDLLLQIVAGDGLFGRWCSPLSVHLQSRTKHPRLISDIHSPKRWIMNYGVGRLQISLMVLTKN